MHKTRQISYDELEDRLRFEMAGNRIEEWQEGDEREILRDIRRTISEVFFSGFPLILGALYAF